MILQLPALQRAESSGGLYGGSRRAIDELPGAWPRARADQPTHAHLNGEPVELSRFQRVDRKLETGRLRGGHGRLERELTSQSATTTQNLEQWAQSFARRPRKILELEELRLQKRSRNRLEPESLESRATRSLSDDLGRTVVELAPQPDISQEISLTEVTMKHHEVTSCPASSRKCRSDLGLTATGRTLEEGMLSSHDGQEEAELCISLSYQGRIHGPAQLIDSRCNAARTSVRTRRTRFVDF